MSLYFRRFLVPISHILVYFVFNDLISECLSRIPFSIPFIIRCVDDLILWVPEGKIEEALCIFNSCNELLRNTTEMESNYSKPFLDMSVHCNETKIVRTK